ncbi:hypothetical protein PSCICM_19740 [Pseudomonas cichorii]|uniref:Uncharacterized protein n=1 Tax=Pseudomonas cichorii TaxID=36746 RepID=A0ABQ1DNR8_PSECI|nr:hypothetical protein PSCICM_19740 [Pseudomonas cichorii]GFM92665.1 hypothetical protein PSCICP_26370 [Pseudomonas cichorii]
MFQIMATVEIITVMAPIMPSECPMIQASNGAIMITPHTSNKLACRMRSLKDLLGTAGRSWFVWLITDDLLCCGMGAFSSVIGLK